jgi:hypothetical protein
LGGVFLKKEVKKDLIKVISVGVVGAILILMIPFLFSYFL